MYIAFVETEAYITNTNWYYNNNVTKSIIPTSQSYSSQLQTPDSTPWQ